MTADSLILGLAAGYHFEDVRPFLVSLRQTGFAGRCVLFASSTTRETERMQAYGATVIPFRRSGTRGHLSYNAYRYFLYRDYLDGPGANWRRVLLTDVRDVLFQSDPMSHPWPAGLNATLEDRRMSLGRCPYNSLWIRHHLGADALEQVADRPISCSGTSIGDLGAMRNYLTAMTERLEPYTPAEMSAGYDQGVHNHLLHTGALGGVTLHDNSGPILTLAYRQQEAETDDAGRVLNDAGVPAVMVHQYDRIPALHAQLRRLYR